jgi:hypothetical protein
MIVVTGPRIDPAELAAPGRPDGLDVRGYVPDLYQHLAACDLAVAQGGLTTTMELTASQRPFIYGARGAGPGDRGRTRSSGPLPARRDRRCGARRRQPRRAHLTLAA